MMNNYCTPPRLQPRISTKLGVEGAMALSLIRTFYCVAECTLRHIDGA